MARNINPFLLAIHLLFLVGSVPLAQIDGCVAFCCDIGFGL